jgi:hypothetical protein
MHVHGHDTTHGNPLCIHIHIHACILTHTYAYIHAYTSEIYRGRAQRAMDWISDPKNMHMHVHDTTHMDPLCRVCVCVCIYICVCTYTYIHTPINIRIHANIHAYLIYRGRAQRAMDWILGHEGDPDIDAPLSENELQRLAEGHDDVSMCVCVCVRMYCCVYGCWCSSQ